MIYLSNELKPLRFSVVFLRIAGKNVQQFLCVEAFKTSRTFLTFLVDFEKQLICRYDVFDDFADFADFDVYFEIKCI